MKIMNNREAFYPHAMVNVSTTPLDLIILLHDGAIESLRKAMLYINKGDKNEKNRHISKVMAIIEELLKSLDFTGSGNIAFNLQRVYAYMLKELTIASMWDDVRRLKCVQEMMRRLKLAWRQI